MNIVPENQPPQKKITFNTLIRSILLYSAKKNIANNIPEYSTLYPATISASASGKSNGALLVSAKDIIKKIIAKGHRIQTFQIFSCANTISLKFNVWLHNTNGIIITVSEIS